MTAVDATLTDIKVALATLGGKIDTMSERIEAGDRQSAQLVALVKDQLAYLSADMGEVKAVVRENEVKANQAVSATRVDLEKQIKELREDLDKTLKTLITSVDELRQWRARVGGIAAAAAALSSITTAVAMKLLGA